MQFYEREEFLYETVTRFVAAGLGGGEGVIVIATAEHLEGLQSRLTKNCFDVKRAMDLGQLTMLDAVETLATLTIDDDDQVDPERFTATMGALVEKAGRGRGGVVRAFSETVDVLCGKGRHAAALQLEQLWNDLIAKWPLSILCGYSMASFDGASHAEHFHGVCSAHSYAASADAFSALKTKDERLRELSLLKQRARALETEIEHRRVLERSLREREAELRGDITERKRAEKRLLAAAQRLEAALEQMPSAVAVVEAPSGKLILANERNAAIFRQPNLPLDGVPAYARFHGRHPDGREIAPDEWPLSRSIVTGEIVRGEEIHIVRTDGSHGYIRVSSSPIRDAEGNIIAGVVTYDDITEPWQQRRVTETLLRVSTILSSELDLDALMQKITDEATALCRAEFGSFFYNVVNNAGESYMLYTLSGVPRDAFANFPMPRNTAIFAPTFSGSAVVRLDNVRNDPRYGKNPPYNGMPRGHLPVTSYLAVPVKTRSGEVLGGLFFGHSRESIFTEADERLIIAISAQAAAALDNARAYQALRVAEKKAQVERQRLHDLFMAAPASIWMLRGPDHVIEFANPAALELYPERELIGKPIATALPQHDRARAELLDHVFRTGEPQVRSEMPELFDWSGDGDPYQRFFDIAYEPLRDENGEVVGVMTFGFEVTEQALARRKIEAIVSELETANRMKDDFLATVSHELRTPLNAILGWTRMLRAGSLPDGHREKALATIERNANAQTQLIEDLLDVSRIISGKLRLEINAVDVPQVVANAIDAVRPAANARGVELIQTIDPFATPILGDAGRLQQVVWNLLSNAVKFTQKGGRVHVFVRRRDSSIEIIVADNGQGIELDFLPHVFERFRQADATISRKHMGLGLGLAIVRHLVELHGGQVSVESEGRDKGATFIVSLPLSPLRSTAGGQPPPVRHPAVSPALACPPELTGIRVLILEDDEDARELLIRVLEPCKAHITAASTVVEALQIVEQTRPDVIVSDIGLPGEDGYAFIRRLRALPASQGGKTPAVALTAYARVEDRTKALVAGFNMHVPKPVEPTELMAVLSSLSTLFIR